MENTSDNKLIIISGAAIYYFYDNQPKLYKLEANYKIKGTFIGLLLKSRREIDKINLYDITS